MNKVRIASPHHLELGPGSTWDRVLKLVPPSKYTIIHGQCRSVGIGGYILGGGINVVGTSEKYGTAGDHVLKYTMVDATGNILTVTIL
jgi:FAD/FMN-containing dehydrogenase